MRIILVLVIIVSQGCGESPPTTPRSPGPSPARRTDGADNANQQQTAENPRGVSAGAGGTNQANQANQVEHAEKGDQRDQRDQAKEVEKEPSGKEPKEEAPAAPDNKPMGGGDLIRKFEESLESDTEMRKELADRLWKSPLGRLFSNFVFGTGSVHFHLDLSHEIVSRVYSNASLTLTRLSALQLMTEDIYERELMTSQLHLRISMLNTAIALKRHAEEAQLATKLLREIPIFVGVGLAWGSPLMRSQVKALAATLFHKVFSIVSRKAGSRASRAFAELDIRRLLGPEFISEYSIMKAGSTFVQTFAGYSIFYYQIKLGTADTFAFPDKIWMYGMQRYVDLDNL
ncbi:MAG: hypothetical protein C5B49_12740 [Bdellovibrio sp.]|nr:MAG: hypothetical protein C5B49_12740 [Bdellovibrio sp.]